MTEVTVPTVVTDGPQPEPSEAIREAVRRCHLNPITACLVDGRLVQAEPVRAWKTSDGQLFQHREDADAHVEEIVRQNRERAEAVVLERRFDAVLDLLEPYLSQLAGCGPQAYARVETRHGITISPNTIKNIEAWAEAIRSMPVGPQLRATP